MAGNYRMLPFMVLIGIGLTVGCGEKLEDRAKVTGKITIDGAPVANGQICFYPVDGGRPSSGKIVNGNYCLTTYEPGDGATIGEHVVTIKVVKEVETTAPSGVTGESSLVEQELHKSSVALELLFLFPKVYADRKTSPIRRNVKNEDNVFDFEASELESK